MSSSLLKPFEKLFSKKGVVEICFNEPCFAWLEFDDGRWIKEKVPHLTSEALESFVSTIARRAGQDFNKKVPRYSGRVPEYGYRIQANYGSMVDTPFSMSIRLGKSATYPINSYMSDSEAQKLIDLIEDSKTIMVVGGTGSGKTSLLNSLIPHIPKEQRIITVEDTRELIIPHENKLHFTLSKTGTDIANVSYEQIINDVMRSRPDRIIMGEIDTKNAYIFLNLANSGHGGGMSTFHADDKDSFFNRFIMNVNIGSGSSTSDDAIKDYIQQGIDALVFISKNRQAEAGKRFTAKVEYLK